jgi:hypothetical protein
LVARPVTGARIGGTLQARARCSKEAQSKDLDAYLRAMVDEGRLIYEFTIERDYGLS